MSVNYILTVPHGTKVEIKYEDRRDPSRGMYQYRTSHDPRIRALERRISSVQTKEERRSGKDRRINRDVPLRFGQRTWQRRKP
mgnify:FL=1